MLTPADALTSIVVPGLEAFATGPHRVRTAFLSGSFLGDAWSRTRPNLNVYFVSGAGTDDAITLRWALRGLWRDLRAKLADASIELVIDCHPYSVPQRRCAAAGSWPVLTITSKVLDGAVRGRRYNLPSTIGPGWASRFRLLTGDASDVELLAPHPARDAEWARTVHRAMSHYKNVIDHLPWAVDRDGRPGDLIEESARYAEESYKDILGVALTGADLACGRHIEILAGGLPSTADFVADRYGPEGSQALEVVLALKALACRADVTGADAEQAWRSANAVWAWAWAHYRRCADEMLPGLEDFQRVDAFV